MYWSARGAKTEPGRRAGAQAYAIISARCARWFFARKICNWSKAPARAARRFIDLLLSQTTRLICRCCSVTPRRCARAMRCLKQPAVRPPHSKVSRGNWLARARRSSGCAANWFPKLRPLAARRTARISQRRGRIALEYQPSVKKDFAVELAQSRRRERSPIAPRSSGRIATNCNCCSTTGPPRNSAAKAKSARWRLP